MPYIPGENEYQAGNDSILSSDDYIFEVEDWSEYTTKEGPFTKAGETRIIFRNRPVAFADDPEADLVDENGDEVDRKSVV